MSIRVRFLLLLASAFTLSACSSAMKQRAEQRDKLSVSSGFFCEFINGDEFQDIDVELNLALARRCDSTKSSSLTNYKNSSDVYGVIYCCTLAKKDEKKSDGHDVAAPMSKAPDATPVPAKADDKKDDKKAAAAPSAANAKPSASPAPASTAPATAAKPAAKPADAKTTKPTEKNDDGILDD